MDTVTLRFTTHWPWNPTSPIIAFLGGSKQFSHVMTVIDGVVYEATMTHGCRVVPLATAMKGVAAYQDMEVPIADKSAAITWGLQQDGKGYDFFGAFGLPFLMSEDWADDSKWWCSELVFMQLLKGGAQLQFDPAVDKRITPEHLLMLNFPKTQIFKLK
jgi:uncharacterized protein YycO